MPVFMLQCSIAHLFLGTEDAFLTGKSIGCLGILHRALPRKDKLFLYTWPGLTKPALSPVYQHWDMFWKFCSPLIEAPICVLDQLFLSMPSRTKMNISNIRILLRFGIRLWAIKIQNTKIPRLKNQTSIFALIKVWSGLLLWF